MDKLAGYGSDDDCEESPKHRKAEHTASYDLTRNSQNKPTRQIDVNYEEVQMDLSEDSNNSDSSSKDTPTSRNDHSSSKSSRNSDHRRDNGRDDEKYSRDSPKYRDYKSRRDDEEDRYRRRDDRDRDRYGSSRSRNDDKYNKEKHRDDRERSYRSRRSSSKERRSRSPRRQDNRNNKRSNSRDREVKSTYTRRYERPNKPEPEKIEVEPNKPVEPPVNVKPETDNKDRFYMPGITGRFKDQIERRKLLWQRKGDEKKECSAPPTTAGKVWQATTFAQDTDGKVASKFKRLMGIREPGDGQKSGTDTLKKQEEMFSSMEAQYEVARTATHTMRGVGLGFSSFQR